MKLGFCVSGGGRIVLAILEAARAGILQFEPEFVIIDRPSTFTEAPGSKNVQTKFIDHSTFASRDDFRATLSKELLSSDADGLFLTFNWLLGADVVKHFSPNLLNLHMSLLPLFPGLGAIGASLKSGMTFTGVTCHRVDAGMDSGPIIAQAVAPLTSGQSLDEIGFALFCRALPICIQCIRWLETERLGPVVDGRVAVAGAQHTDGVFSPALDHDIFEFANEYIKARHKVTL